MIATTPKHKITAQWIGLLVKHKTRQTSQKRKWKERKRRQSNTNTCPNKRPNNGNIEME
jgi:ribosome-interacting GTPase 1